jgi:undecaprenyl-diphosphatase
MTFFDALILSFVEGITEFLPISSTGHMILTSSLLGIQAESFVKTFEVAIQLGAVLAIVALYARTLVRGILIYKKLFVAFVPAGVLGFLFHDVIKTYLFSPEVVAWALIGGGVVLLFVDRWFEKREQSRSAHESADLEKVSYRSVFWIGVFQCLALIPGVSRAGATIVGGMVRGLSRAKATEFSFLLALPTMVVATGFDLLKTSADFSLREYELLALGILGAFVSAFFAVRFFLRFVERRGFALFGWYRIVVGVVVLVVAVY